MDGGKLVWFSLDYFGLLWNKWDPKGYCIPRKIAGCELIVEKIPHGELGHRRVVEQWIDLQRLNLSSGFLGELVDVKATESALPSVFGTTWRFAKPAAAMTDTFATGMGLFVAIFHRACPFQVWNGMARAVIAHTLIQRAVFKLTLASAAVTDTQPSSIALVCAVRDKTARSSPVKAVFPRARQDGAIVVVKQTLGLHCAE
ncbi:unnamed protein product [Aphanomyces euteiches]|uniref:Uncharacterized protein n=1 Tax=Aphanomyces euteiches TaxID=100861 RepID=A0A6G0XE47_9STRA|nr:hypothetical protein Ae201684_005664 [Aphanomyces euteiches]KAH9078055.1 hypothetical protein Ae201684P_019161 [Aphanomyces euteiches]